MMRDSSPKTGAEIGAEIGAEQPAPSAVELELAVRRKVCVVIPAYNEAQRVGDVVREVNARYPHIVAVDDGSADDTAARCLEAGATVLRHVINRGQGAALQTGITHALKHGFEYIVTFDSDGQHDPDDIAALVSPIAEGRWDISLGSRFLGCAEDIPQSRRMLLRGGVLFTRAVSRVKITDTHNGLRAFSRRAASGIEITLDRMAHASELLDQVRESGLPYGEVPVHIRYTAYSVAKGQSSGAAFKILFHYIFNRLAGR